MIEDWRWKYNNYRPHRLLGYITPLEFAMEVPAVGLLAQVEWEIVVAISRLGSGHFEQVTYLRSHVG